MNCALITGGSRGIGKAISVALAGMGYYVIINYRTNRAEAENTLALVKEKGGDGEILCFDVADKEQVKTILGNWIEINAEKHIEVLINNAGIKDDALMLYMQDEQWENVIKNNLDSFFFVTRLVLNGMLLKKYGRIINIVSLSGQKGLPGQTNYSAAKAGVIGATKALAQEIGRHGITVNAVAPGLIRTDMTEGMDENEMKKVIPVRRFGTPEEVAHAVKFLASKDASYITAEVISINGGLYS